MLGYLIEHQHYHPMNSWNGGYVLAWNVKVHNADYSGKGVSDYPVQDRFAAQWEAYSESNSDLFWECCADAARYYTEGEWSNYPDIEQGEWKFGMNGRSNGYMVLTDAPSWLSAPRAWAAFPMIWHDSDAFAEWCAELDTPKLRRFYRAVRVLDQDLDRKAVAREVSYHFAFRRAEWEQDLIEQEDCEARELEASRPDMVLTEERKGA